MKRPNGDSAKRSSGRRQSFRLQLEPLEGRRLLAGLNVSVLIDQDGSRNANSADTAATGRLVYLDINQNGVQDDSDPFAITNEAGVAKFDGLEAGFYDVALSGIGTSQAQSFPTSVEPIATQIAAASGTLLYSEDLAHIWAFNQRGVGQSLASDLSVQLSGPVKSAIVSGTQALLLVDNPITGATLTSRSSLIVLDLVDGTISWPATASLGEGSVVDLFGNGSKNTFAKVTDASSSKLVPLQFTANQELRTGTPIPISSNAQVYVSNFTNHFATVEPLAGVFARPTAAKATINVYNSQTGQLTATRTLQSNVNDVAFDRHGTMVFVSHEGLGVSVYQNDRALTEIAQLVDATSPITADAVDGRFIAASPNHASKLTVWNTKLWTPVGGTRFPTDQTITDVKVIEDALVVTTESGLYRAGLAKPTAIPVAVREGTESSVTLGVVESGTNSPPSSNNAPVNVEEDSKVDGNLRSRFSDPDNDSLWFRLQTQPAHGRLQLTPSGLFTYTPEENFDGVDHATVWVMDGQSIVESSLTFDMFGVNDPPEKLQLTLAPLAIPENARGGMYLGQVQVDDPDSDASYHFVTSDRRFEVRNGGLYIAADAVLDFENEPYVDLQITAFDDTESGYVISTLSSLPVSDINEPMLAARVLDATVVENRAGAIAGSIEIEDPDSQNQFKFSVSDSRFQVIDGKLQLKPNAKVDFEKESQIALTISVEDGSGQSISTNTVVNVVNENDAPTDIQLATSGVESNKFGAVVGKISVVDQDNDAYEFSVSDPRFVVADGFLRLASGKAVAKSEGPILVTVTATGSTKDTIAKTVVIPVKANPVAIVPVDVNNDGQITPIDVMLLINYLNKHGSGPARPELIGTGEEFNNYDVNGDGLITPLDALLLIQFLNARSLTLRGGGEGESAPPQQSDDVLPPADLFSHGSTKACPAVADAPHSADAELESLLDHLSRERLKKRISLQ